MKKVIYLISILFAVALLSTSCCKDDDPIIEDQITVEDLLGDWNFVSLEFEGDIYDTPEELNILNVNYDLVALDFNFTATEATYSTEYVDEGQENPFIRTYSYTLSGTPPVINCYDQIKFEVVNAETFDGSVLELKLIFCVQNGTVLNGTYTLERP
jgi:hypothetical protein